MTADPSGRGTGPADRPDPAATARPLDEDATVRLLQQLVRCASVTPDDAGCQTLIAQHLAPLGFTLETLESDGVTNLWARLGERAPLFAFAGHTDVVPPGDVDAWRSHPFAAVIEDGVLTGRGAADMKGSLAAMVTATERFLARHPAPSLAGSLAFLITSDEEGPAIAGTRHVIDTLQARGEHIDFCLVGEPTSARRLGDTARLGRRGSLSATLLIKGVQGHVAYPQLADNPIHRAMPLLAELTAIEWDQGDAHFPPTSLQISNLHGGSGAGNVIPGSCQVEFNLRFSPATTPEQVRERVAALLHRHAVQHEIHWRLSASPFITGAGRLSQALSRAIGAVTGQSPLLDTGGGTSDGRFIAPTGSDVLEFGPLNASIHQTDEHIDCRDLQSLSCIYERLLEELLITSED